MSTTPQIWYDFRNSIYAKDFSVANKLLHETPALLYLTSGIGETVLHFLAVENDLEGVAWLHARGADLDTKNSFGTPAIFEVAQLGYKELFSWLLENGANRHAEDGDGQDLINYLLEYDQSEMAEWVQRHM